MMKGIARNANEFKPFSSIEIPPSVEPNIFDRLFFLADRVVGAKGYEEFLGIRLGILPKPQKALVPDELEPKLKAKPLGQAKIEVRFVRGKTSGVNLYFMRSDREKVYDLGRFFYSPATVTFPLLDGQKPEQILLFARYLIGNDAVGKSSDRIELVVAP